MLLLCLAAIWLTGFGVVRSIAPQPLRWSLHNVFLFSLAIGAGAGIASCCYFLALWAAGPSVGVLISVMAAVLLLALVLGFLAKTRGPELKWGEGEPVPWYLTAVFAIAVALALTMFLSAVISNPHGDEGAWSIWNLRARFLFRAGAFWRDAFSSELGWTHLDYPLLLPGLVAMCWRVAGAESHDAPIAIAFLFALGTAGLLVTALGALRGKMHALVAGTLLLGTASYIALSAAQYGDVPLSFYILAALVLVCLEDRYPGNPRFIVLAGLMAGFTAWTRNDGLLFVVALIAARAIALVRYGARGQLAGQLVRLGLGLAAPIGVVAAFKLGVGGPNLLASTPAATIFGHLADSARWIEIVEGLIIMLINFGRFLIPIALALGLYWYLVRFRVSASDRPAVATTVIALLLTLGLQLLLDLLYAASIQVEIGTSFERILLQLWPAALLAFFLASGPLQLSAIKPQKKAAKAGRRMAETR